MDKYIDWDKLLELAQEVSTKAYAPYSGYPVGAAGVTASGRFVKGCNVENASTGLGLCAECAMISDLVCGGHEDLVAVVCVNGKGERLMPCGRCRQLLWEHGGPDCLVWMPSGIKTMSEVLPDAFGEDDLRAITANPRV